MRVLYLGASLRMRLSSHAAPEIRALGLIQGLEQAGAQVIPLMAGDQLDFEEARTVYSNGLKRFLPQSISGVLRDLAEIIFDRKLYRIIETQVRKIKPDIILQKHSRYGQVGVRIGRKYQIPVFLDDITPIWEGEQFGDRSLKPIARLIRKRIFSQAAGLIAVSPGMQIQLQSENIPENRIFLVPNGVDCALFDPDNTYIEIRQKFGLVGKIVVGYLGIFAEWHKLDLLIRTAALVTHSVPNIHFLLVGDNRDEKLRDLAREQGVADHFTFVGSMPHGQVPIYLNAMDFCVIPSTLPYMSPMKIYEYMAMRKPVIAPTGNSIIETMVVPNKNGLLFEPGSENSLANAITTLATRPEMVRELGAEARKLVENNYNWYQQTRVLYRAFEVALATPGLPVATSDTPVSI
jgi:glycosyltransferase involved in cell wall biosynthesis